MSTLTGVTLGFAESIEAENGPALKHHPGSNQPIMSGHQSLPYVTPPQRNKALWSGLINHIGFP